MKRFLTLIVFTILWIILLPFVLLAGVVVCSALYGYIYCKTIVEIIEE